MTLLKTLTLLAAATASVDASTTVAVMELGKGGVVRRTTSTRNKTTVRGVSSFWTALHSSDSYKRQHAGMTVVPDLFHKADSGLIVGLTGSGVDLAAMPTVSALVEKEGGSGVVGHFTVTGAQGKTLLNEAGATPKSVDAAALANTRAQSGLHAVEVHVDQENAGTVDEKVAALIESITKQAEEAGTTIVLHLVVEEEEGAARRRLTSRRLEDEQQEEGEENNEQEEEGEGENENGDNNNAQGNENGYYGYGYYNDSGEWVTPYKTMFQIQYFNVVLWTTIALLLAVLYSVKLMVGMPLMADTLLFGESAKMMGD